MNWSELIAATAERAGMSRSDARRALEAFREVVTDELADSGHVVLFGLGTFRTRRLAPRSIRTIREFRKMYLGERATVGFRPASALRRRVSEGLATHWKDPAHQAAWRLSEALVGDLELYHGKKAPKGLEGDDDAIRASCATAFGSLWDRVVSSYDRDVSSEVRGEHDHLAAAARAHWSSTEPEPRERT